MSPLFQVKTQKKIELDIQNLIGNTSNRGYWELNHYITVTKYNPDQVYCTDTLKVSKLNAVWHSFKHNFGTENTNVNEKVLEHYLDDLFSVGETYFYVIDFSSFPKLRLSYIHPSTTKYHGIEEKEFTLNHVLSAVHADDMPFCIACEEVIMKFFAGLDTGEMQHYKTSYTLRIKDRFGNYRYIQHQGISIALDQAGRMAHALNVHTDVSHIKQESCGTMSLLGMNGRPSYIGIDPFNPSLEEENPLTPSEHNLLELLAKGLTSKEAAAVLNISKYTVDTHRRNMLKKKGVKNTVDLIRKAKTNLLFHF